MLQAVALMRDSNKRSSAHTRTNEAPTNGKMIASPSMIAIAVFHFGKS